MKTTIELEDLENVHNQLLLLADRRRNEVVRAEEQFKLLRWKAPLVTTANQSGMDVGDWNAEVSQANDRLLMPLVYTMNGSTYYGIQMPQCFPSMTSKDRLRISHWYISKGTHISHRHLLLEVESNYGVITIPMPPALRGIYRVSSIIKLDYEPIQLGDLLIIFQKVEKKVHQQRDSLTKVA